MSTCSCKYKWIWILAFMWCKIDVSPKDTLISAMKDFYSQDDLKIARDIFSKVSDKRLAQQKSETILSSIYETMQAAPKDSFPMFVAPNLNNIPCISLSNIDGASLVCKQASLQAALDSILREQTEMKAKIAAIEGCQAPPLMPNIISNSALDRRQTAPMMQDNALSSASDQQPRHRSNYAGAISRNNVVDLTANPSLQSDAEFTQVQGRRQHTIHRRNIRTSANNSDQSQRRRDKNPPVTGKKEGTTLRAVEQVRKINIFVSRLHPDETDGEICNYAKNIISADCTVRKLPTKFPTYSSFVITCDAKYENKILSPDEWSNGVIIRKFYGPLTSNDTNSTGNRGNQDNTS